MRTLGLLADADLKDLQIALPEWDVLLDNLKVELAGHAFAGRYNGELLGCGGVVTNDLGGGHAWLIVTPAILRYPMAGVHLMQDGLEWARRHGNLRRIEAHVLCTQPQAIKLARVLGFQREGKAREYMPDGADAYTYAWVSQGSRRKVRGRKEEAWSGLLLSQR